MSETITKTPGPTKDPEINTERTTKGLGTHLKDKAGITLCALFLTGVLQACNSPDQNSFPPYCLEQQPNSGHITSTAVPQTSQEQNQLPADTVPPSELKRIYHTTIWNIPKTKLHVRRRALEEEEIFRDLGVPGSGRTLDIILLDGDSVHSSFMTPEQREKLPDLVEVLKEEEAASREELLRRYQEERPAKQAEYLQKLASIEPIRQTCPRLYEVIKSVLYEVYRPYISRPTEKDLMRSNKAGGHIILLRTPNRDKVQHYILLPVRSTPLPRSVQELIGIFKTQNLSPEITRIIETLEIFGNPGLSLNQSYPSPHDYPISDDGIEGQSPGVVLHHEFAHYIYPDEYEADLEALRKIRMAYEAFLRGDDTGYYFVFETPEGLIYTYNGNGGSTDRRVKPNTRAHRIQGHGVESFRQRAAAKYRLGL